MALADPPGWLVDAVRVTREPVCPTDDKQRIPNGQRDSTLTSLAGSMRRPGFDQDAIYGALCAHNRAYCVPPLPDADVRKIARSVGRYTPDAAIVRAANADHYKLLSPAEVLAMPPIEWRVKHILPARGLAQVYGPSRSGKSFLVFDMACAIAEGRDWFKYRVKQAPVVYVALEGEAGFRHRMEAWQTHTGRAVPEFLHMVMQPFSVSSADNVASLAAVIPEGSVTIIDTQARASSGLDENAFKDMSVVMDAARRLATATDGLVIFVAHTGKDEERGARGSSDQIGTMDAAIAIKRNGDARV